LRRGNSFALYEIFKGKTIIIFYLKSIHAQKDASPPAVWRGGQVTERFRFTESRKAGQIVFHHKTSSEPKAHQPACGLAGQPLAEITLSVALIWCSNNSFSLSERKRTQ